VISLHYPYHWNSIAEVSCKSQRFSYLFCVESHQMTWLLPQLAANDYQSAGDSIATNKLLP
jgi:hypothetical protein